MNSDISAIEALEDAISTIADPAQFDRFYTPDVLLYDGIAPGIYRGIDALKQAFTEQLVGVAVVETIFRARDVDVSGDLAYANSIQDITVTMDDGSKRQITCRATEIFRRVEGEWKISHQHLSYPIDPATGRGILFNAIA